MKNKILIPLVLLVAYPFLMKGMEGMDYMKGNEKTLFNMETGNDFVCSIVEETIIDSGKQKTTTPIKNHREINEKDFSEDKPQKRAFKSKKKLKLSLEEQKELNLKLLEAIFELKRGGKISSVLELIDEGADVNVKQDILDRRPIHWACSTKNLDLVKLLVLRGANVNVEAPDREGWTPLFWFIKNCDLDMVKFFVERGADATFKNKQGESVLNMFTGWSLVDLNELCQYLVPFKKRTFETLEQQKIRTYLEKIIYTQAAEALKKGILPFSELNPVGKQKNLEDASSKKFNESVVLLKKVMSFYFVPRTQPLVSTSVPNRELSEKQYRLALELFDCSKSAVLKVLTDHPEIRKQLGYLFGNLFKAMENANGKKRFFKDLNIRFHHDFNPKQFFKNVEK
ncbi:TPA: hypothetical protein DDZ86_03030 [Candidatus Dependentiae bacterium]|nr:MAG: Ankyrin repeat domain protein [candidate division TM6 bacterium GW2011_GWF2_43_87]HBL98593.1 hypothetical protein [Candidatus Dependentiae bacterium]